MAGALGAPPALLPFFFACTTCTACTACSQVTCRLHALCSAMLMSAQGNFQANMTRMAGVATE